MESLAHDLRYALRQLRRSPGFAAVAVATLALGVGANAAMFSLVRGVLLRPLPYRDAERLATARLSFPDFEDLRAGTRSFDDLAVWASNLYVLAGDEGGEQVLGAVVSERFFPLLGIAARGRSLGPEDRDAAVAVLSHRLWVRRFGADPAVLGRAIRLYGKPHTVVGVMRAEFQFPNGRFEVWVPLQSALAATSSELRNRSLRIFNALGRLRPGVGPPRAQAEVDGLAARLAREHPESNEGVEISFAPIYERLVGGVRTPLLVLMGVVALVLLIACANVANLLLARAKAREREVAVRTALGAGRGRLLRQLLTESLVLALAGSALGLLVAGAILDVLPALTPFELPRLPAVRIDVAVLAFATALSVATAVLFGLAPAWQASRADVTTGLREGARGTGGPAGRRLRRALTSGEVALALIVLISAGLLVQSLARLLRVDAGFRAENLLTLNVVFVGRDRGGAALADEVITRLRRIPGVTAAGAGTGLPPVTAQRAISFAVEGAESAPADERRAYFMAVTPEYFKALGTPVVAGRAFVEGDGAGAPEVVVLGRSLAQRLFGGSSALGRRIRLVNPDRGAGWRSVVGVVGDVRYAGLSEAAGGALYTPFAQTPFPWINAMVRTAGRPESLVGAVRQAVKAVDPGLDATAVRPMEQVLAETVAQPRFNVILLSAFTALALALATLGVYGVVSYSVAQRTREIGVRMALGAGGGDIVRLVVGEGLRLAGWGVVLGLLGASAATRALDTLLFEVRPTDPVTFAAAVAFLALVAAVASAVPAWRAGRIAPAVALRTE